MPAPKQPHFRYDQLQDPDNEIRLLSLQREKSRDLLQFTLFTVPFPSVPRYRNEQGRLTLPVLTATPYQALSYEWGQPDGCKVILVDGVEFHVQTNLHSFLNAIHFHYKDRLPLNIWVDAVCINQDTADTQNGEKNHQVRMMGRIYSRAEMVLVWLGEDYDMSGAKSLLKETIEHFDIASMFERNTKGPSQEKHGLQLLTLIARSQVNDCPTSKFDLRILYVKDHIENTVKTLMPLWSQSYWNRLWIIQELVLAQDFTVLCDPKYCGSDTSLVRLTKAEVSAAYLLYKGIEFAHFEAYYFSKDRESSADDQVATLGDPDPSTSAALRKVVFEATKAFTASAEIYKKLLSTVWGPPWGESLEDLITRFIGHDCSDSRDSVYGLIGMAYNVTEDTAFKVDYEGDFLDLIAFTMVWCHPGERLRVAESLLRVHTADAASNTRRNRKDFDSDWLTAQGTDIRRKGSKYLSKVVTIKIYGRENDVSGETFLTLDFYGGITVTCQADQDRLILADVEDPENPATIGRNSLLALDYGFGRYPSIKRKERIVTDGGYYLVETELCEILYLLVLGIYNRNYGKQPDLCKTPPALTAIKILQRSVFGHRNGLDFLLS